MLLNYSAGEDSWESPLDSKEIKPVNPKENQPCLFIETTDAEAEAPILWPLDVESWLIGKDPDARKDWGQEEKGMIEDEMVGWPHWLNGHGFEQTPGHSEGQGRLTCCSPWGHRVRHNLVTEWQQQILSDIFELISYTLHILPDTFHLIQSCSAIDLLNCSVYNHMDSLPNKCGPIPLLQPFPASEWGWVYFLWAVCILLASSVLVLSWTRLAHTKHTVFDHTACSETYLGTFSSISSFTCCFLCLEHISIHFHISLTSRSYTHTVYLLYLAISYLSLQVSTYF